MNFEQLNLMKPLLEAVTQCGYDEPTPIQRETIPAVLDGRDVLGCAQTGTGKTAAFALPMLQRLSLEAKQRTGKRSIRALILTPTRELALQIFENFEDYGKRLPLRACVVFGGVNQQPQVQQLKAGVDILVATPGRLNDLIGQGFIALDHIEIFVLDEADRMLDMGFIHDVRKVIAQLPQKRQTLFFSATMPPEVEKLAMGILTKPYNVKVDPVTSTVDAIDQCVYLVDKANKKLLLADLLSKPGVESALVFTRTKHGADKLARDLSRMDIRCPAIHGDKSQAARQEALSQFKTGKTRVLIATDIAARGIDVAGLSHVFNYDLPNEPEAYIHRIGRTGRAGLEGTAVSFCCIDEMKELYAIEKLIGKHIPRKESAWPMAVFEETVKQPRPPRPGRGGTPAAQVADVNRDGTAKAEKKRGADSRAQGAGGKGREGRKTATSAVPADSRDSRDSRRSAAPADSRAQSAGGKGREGRKAVTPAAPADSRDSRRSTASADNRDSRRNAALADSRDSRAQSASGKGREARKASAAPAAPAPREPVPESRYAASLRAADAPRDPNRFSASAHQPAPEMRATPLERPLHALPTRRASGDSAPREDRYEPREEPTYARPRRQAPRRPLSTGEDRK